MKHSKQTHPINYVYKTTRLYEFKIAESLSSPLGEFLLSIILQKGMLI